MPQVEIRVAGHLDEKWADWLDDFAFQHTGENETILTGSVRDQASLYGLIAKLRDLGLTLKVIRFDEEALADDREAESGCQA